MYKDGITYTWSHARYLTKPYLYILVHYAYYGMSDYYRLTDFIIFGILIKNLAI